MYDRWKEAPVSKTSSIRSSVSTEHRLATDTDKHTDMQTDTGPYDKIRYDTRCYFNVQSNADMSQLNLQHGTNN